MKMNNNSKDNLKNEQENSKEKTLLEKIKAIIHNKSFIASLFIIIVSIISLIPMFDPNYNIQFNDGVQHICRLIGTEQSIKEGELIPVIMSNFCNGFGYSWNLFYSPVTAYLPLIFRIFTTSYEMCMKLFVLAVSIGSGFAMYFFMKKFLNGYAKCKQENKTKECNINNKDTEKQKFNSKLDNNKIEMIAILASVLYILLPYRLNDIYLRMAVSELASFMFLPIVFNGLYSIVNLKEKSWLLVLGGAGMLLTHSMLTVYVVIFCVIYLLINIKKLDKKTILTLFINAGIILLLTAFYWIPLLQAKLSTDYEVFNEDHMIRWDVMIALKAMPLELAFYIPGRMYYGIGILVIIGTVLSFTILKRKEIDRKNYAFFLICGLISTIMALDFFPFEKLPSIFTMMQFSYRMLEFGGFFLVICASIAIGMSADKFNIYTVMCLTCISILLLLPNLKEIPKGSYFTEDELIKGIPVISETGRVHAGCASFEYLPNKAFENRAYIETRENVPIILNKDSSIENSQIKEDERQNIDSKNESADSKNQIKNYYKNGTNCSFEISANSTEKDLEIELPYIYYIGYNVQYTDESGIAHKVETYESENGFLCIDVPNENITVNVKYTGTVLMKVAYIVSLITVFALLFFAIYSKIIQEKTLILERSKKCQKEQ